MRRHLISWTKPMMEEALRRFNVRQGRYPYFDECLQTHALPPRPALVRTYGSLAAAIAAAGGIPPPKRRREAA